MEILYSLIAFIIGVVLGVHIKSVLFTRLNWSLLKWDNDIFAYRPAQKGTLIQRSDKVFMAIQIPTSNMPKEGFRYE